MSCPNITPRKKFAACGEMNIWLPSPFEIRKGNLYHNNELYAKYKREEGDYHIFEVVAENEFMTGVEIKLLIRDGE